MQPVMLDKYNRSHNFFTFFTFTEKVVLKSSTYSCSPDTVFESRRCPTKYKQPYGTDN